MLRMYVQCSVKSIKAPELAPTAASVCVGEGEAGDQCPEQGD